MRIAVCCDLSDENLEACVERFKPTRTTTDYQDAIADDGVDAICLATTERLRLPVIEAAAAAGKPIFVEKPLARELPEMRRIQEVVHDAGIPFCVGHNRRSAPAMRHAHHVFRRHMASTTPCPWRFDRGSEGRPDNLRDDVAGIHVRINDDWRSWKAWVFDPQQAPHGAMLFEMTHFTDVCNWFMADEPVEVSAMATEPFHHGVVIRYAGGGIATIGMCATGTFGYPKELYEMMGRGGLVAIDHMIEVRTAGIEDEPVRLAFDRVGPDGALIPDPRGIAGWLDEKRDACDRAAAAGDPMRQFEASEPDKGHARHLERFVEQIRGGDAVCGVDEALKASEVAMAAVRSAASGQAVTLAELS